MLFSIIQYIHNLLPIMLTYANRKNLASLIGPIDRPRTGLKTNRVYTALCVSIPRLHFPIIIYRRTTDGELEPRKGVLAFTIYLSTSLGPSRAQFTLCTRESHRRSSRALQIAYAEQNKHESLAQTLIFRGERV